VKAPLRNVFERVEQDGSGVRVHFANGRSERADLLVECDGFRSSVRAHLAPEAQPIYSGYYIWRGAPNESDLSPETRRTMFPYYSFFLADQLQALGYPISGLDDELRTGHRRYNFGWYRAKLKQMCVDDHGHEYEFGVQPDTLRGFQKSGTRYSFQPVLEGAGRTWADAAAATQHSMSMRLRRNCATLRVGYLSVYAIKSHPHASVPPVRSHGVI
jgi:hypothetical protein